MKISSLFSMFNNIHGRVGLGTVTLAALMILEILPSVVCGTILMVTALYLLNKARAHPKQA